MRPLTLQKTTKLRAKGKTGRSQLADASENAPVREKQREKGAPGDLLLQRKG